MANASTVRPVRFVQPGSAEMAQVVRLWNARVGEADFLYNGFASQREAEEKLLLPEVGVEKVVLLSAGDDAFACGCHVEGDPFGYVTMVLTAPARTRCGLGTAMLDALERTLVERFGVREARILYFDPVTLTWTLPGRPGVEHPNAPGVDIASAAYAFFRKNGYSCLTRQNSYYLPLESFSRPPRIAEAADRLAAAGCLIRPYDPETMTGMREMLEGLGNPWWQRDILGEPAPKDGGRPILVPVRDGRVLGFAGPMDVEKNGRGYFSGIAVDASARGQGLAGVLFSALCQGLRDLGARYMTLFTGADNPARRIYEGLGFTVVRTWEDMQKVLPEM